MIKVFYGENRAMAEAEAKRFLGGEYEAIEGAELEARELVNIFFGQSLFAAERKILIRDLLTNKAVTGELEEYLETPHQIALLELKVDKRSNVYKTLKDKVEFVECKLPRDANAGVVFDVYAVAKRDGKKAVEMLRRIEQGQEPIMFFGLMVSQAMKDYVARPSVATKKVLKNLAKLDMELKTSGMDPWLLIESFLMTLA